MLKTFWRAYRPPTADLVVAAIAIVVGQVVTWAQIDSSPTWQGSRPTNAVLNLLLMSALAWRRRAPLGAVVFAFVVYFLPHPLFPHDMTFLVGGIPLIALTASAGYHAADRRRALLALGLGWAGLISVSLGTPELGSWDSVAWNGLFMTVPWLGARGIRNREERAATLASTLATERASKEAALQAAVTAERAHIARELHDIVAHNVSMMVIQIGAARVRLRSGPAGVEDALLDAEGAGRNTLEDLRRLLGLLRAEEAGEHATGPQPEPPQPGLADLEVMVAPVRDAGLEVELHRVGEPVALPAALDLTAYRIVQEALTNILKHSGAGRATARLTYTDAALSIEVIDDGRATPARGGEGKGLVGINERVALYGGAASAGPAEGGGWKVRAVLPLPGAATEERRSVALPAP